MKLAAEMAASHPLSIRNSTGGNCRLLEACFDCVQTVPPVCRRLHRRRRLRGRPAPLYHHTTDLRRRLHFDGADPVRQLRRDATLTGHAGGHAAWPAAVREEFRNAHAQHHENCSVCAEDCRSCRSGLRRAPWTPDRQALVALTVAARPRRAETRSRAGGRTLRTLVVEPYEQPAEAIAVADMLDRSAANACGWVHIRWRGCRDFDWVKPARSTWRAEPAGESSGPGGDDATSSSAVPSPGRVSETEPRVFYGERPTGPGSRP